MSLPSIESINEPKRPNGYVGRVFPLVRERQPAWEIEAETGLHGTRLIEAIRGVYRGGFLPLPSKEEREMQHRVNTSASRGRILLNMLPYLPLDLTARQTQVGLHKDHDIYLSLDQIASGYAREKHRHGLVRPIAELTIEAQRDKRRPERVLLEIVHTRQRAQKLIAPGAPKPSTLHEWKLLEARLEPEDLTQLKSILPFGLPIPETPGHRRFLIELHEMLEHFKKEGVLSLAYNPLAHLTFDETPRKTLRGLKPQIMAIGEKFNLRESDITRILGNQ